MNKNTVAILAFISGAAVGVAASWKFFKTKYEQIAQEEIDSVKEVFSERVEEMKEASLNSDNEDAEDEEEDDSEISKPLNSKPDLFEYASKIEEEGYANYNRIKREKGAKKMKKPYVISPDEFDEKPDYDVVSLTYYADGVLADDEDHIIEDVEGTVGVESLSHFGEYEDDSVFVRNEAEKIDYEILRDMRKYFEIVRDKNYPMEG